MKDYNSVTDLKLSFTDGLSNASGIAELAYFIPNQYIETYADVDPEAATGTALVTITGNHVLKAGKAPIPMEPLFDKSGYDGSLEGEVLSKIWHQGPARFFLPQVNADALGGATAIPQMRGIVLFQRMNGSEFYQVGSKKIKARVATGTVSFGTGPTGEPGIALEFESYSDVPIFIYAGELPAPAED